MSYLTLIGLKVKEGTLDWDAVFVWVCVCLQKIILLISNRMAFSASFPFLQPRQWKNKQATHLIAHLEFYTLPYVCVLMV